MANERTVFRLFCVLIVWSLIFGSFAAVGGASNRTGTNANEPTTGFSEGQEIIEIYHANGDHDTSFDMAETLYIRITTNLVTDVPNQNNNNRVTFWDETGNKIANDFKPFFMQTVATAPYEYEGTLDITGGNGFAADHDYLVELVLREGGQSKVIFNDVIHINGPGALEESSIKLFSDPAYSTETYIFPPLSPLYLEVWTGQNATDPGSSWVYVSNYQELVVSKQISQLDDPTITDVANYTRFVYDISADFGNGFTLSDGHWYTISVIMNDGNNVQIKDWSVQFMINFSMANPPVVTQSDTTADPASIIVGLDTTTISTDFSHADSPSADAFTITYKVRDELGIDYVLVDQNSNGEAGLIVTQDLLDSTKYTATFDWAPGSGQPTGLYDLYFKIEDGVATAEDLYINNENELELRPQPNLPVIAAGITSVDPVSLRANGTEQTVVSVNFSHQDSPTADSFKITFKVRDPGNSPPIVLVDQAQSGSSGLIVVKTGNNTYEANFTWDPADDAILGTYDLSSRVEDGNGAWAEDSFAQNLEELTLTKDAGVPTVISGSTSVDPMTVNADGSDATLISTSFHHSDIPGASFFDVTYMVRDESGTNYTLVDNKKNGIGGLSILDHGGGDYQASYSWNPPDAQLTGTYDLYFMVKDINGVAAIDGFDANPDELTVKRKPIAPVMTAGVTNADPATVNVMGNETTILSTTFFHADKPSITSFKIGLKIRDVGNQEYDILKDGSDGTPGLTITTDGAGEYNASYIWDPPSVGQPLGTYDLYASVIDSNSLSVMDGFNSNLEELNLIRKAVDPGNSTISGTVTDIDGKPMEGVTVKIYNSSSNAVVKTLTTGADGKFTTTLPAGIYDIGVQATDYKGEVLSGQQLNDGKPLTVPDFQLLKTGGGTGTTKTITKEVIPSYMMGILVLLIVIILLLFLFMVMKGRSGSAEADGGKRRPGHHPHTVDEDDFDPDHPLKPKEKEEIEHEPKPISPDKVEIKPLEEEPGDPE